MSPDLPATSRRRLRPERPAFALITTLAVMALITIMVVALLASVENASKAARGYGATTEIENLKDSAISMVIGQIRAGTTERDPTNDDQTTLWTSQPGAIRTFKPDSGQRLTIFKLFSDDEMTVPLTASADVADLTLRNDAPADWDSVAPGVYADLNEPQFFASDGELHFPIIDPRVKDGVPGAGSVTPEGFDYQVFHPGTSTPVSGVQQPGTNVEDQRLPMPVRFIYQLKDGTMGTLDDSGKFQAFSGQNGIPSKKNPMVGRFAFWADDESCKINLNTASEAIFWDTPRVASPEDVGYAEQKPAKNEVQRFGGHPASVCLSSVLFPGEYLSDSLSSTSSKNKIKAIYDLVPRVNYKTDSGAVTGAVATTGDSKPVVFDDDRLFSNVEEALLKPDRTEDPLFDYLTPQRLARSKFFLTANSRAPEVTAAGTPRVALWPIHFEADYVRKFNNIPTDPSRLTAFDNLIAFAATLAGRPYYFRRNGSRTNLYEYNNGNPNDPSVGVREDEDALDHSLFSNHDLAKYLLWLARDKRLGYSLSVENKFDPDDHHDQNGYMNNVATGVLSFMEYMRQTNLNDNSLSSAGNGSRVRPYAYEYTNSGIWKGGAGQMSTMQAAWLRPPNWDPADDGANVGTGIPHFHPRSGGGRGSIKSQTYESWTRGTARENALGEFGFVLSLAAERESTGAVYNQPLANYLNLPKGYKALQMAFLADGFCPSQGWSMISPTNGVRVKYTGDIQVVTSEGAMIAAGPLSNRAAVEAGNAVPQQAPENRWSYKGADGFLMSVFRLQDRDWYIGWGGSSGRKMFMGVDVTGDAKSNRSYPPDPYPPSTGGSPLKMPNGYSRGFFIVPGTDSTVHVTSAKNQSRGNRLLWLETGDQRDGGGGSKKFLLQFPEGGVEVQVPDRPVFRLPTWGERFAHAAGPAFSGSGSGVSDHDAELLFSDPEVIDPSDVVRTWVSRHGDYRMHYMREREGWGMSSDKQVLIPHPDWNPSKRHVHSFMEAGGGKETPNAGGLTTLASFQRELVPGAGYAGTQWQPDFVINPANPEYAANLRTRSTSANQPMTWPYSIDPAVTRDFDNGYGMAPDGAYWGKPDDTARESDGSLPPYFNEKWDGPRTGQSDTKDETIAPNQMVPSAVEFGSIPSAAYTGAQWTTYLFRPDIGGQGHLGERDHTVQGTKNGAPPDHVILDWFWMPVVQPYAISEPFSTAGKINMNCGIVPFGYVERSTGIHAVLKSERMLAIPNGVGRRYKDYASRGQNTGWRHRIDGDETLKQWDAKFAAGEVFRTASEICEQYLVPQGTTLAGIQSFWNSHNLTGDNTLEKPYANIYARLTTKSNVFRVHVLAQSISKSLGAAPDEWNEERDRVVGEWRGEALVERAIDPNDPEFVPDASTTALNRPFDYVRDVVYDGKQDGNPGNGTKPLDEMYAFRVLYTRRFAP